MKVASVKSRFDRASSWARRHFSYAGIERVRNVPWGQTYRLTAGNRTAFLKLFPEGQEALAASVAAIASLPTGAVARVIAHDGVKGFLLSDDHGGTADTTLEPTMLNAVLLRNYAQIQAVATEHIDTLGAVARFDVAALLAGVEAFLAPRAGATPGEARLSDFFGLRYAGLAAEAFRISRSAIETMIRESDHLPLTLNHCDLHAGNIAFDPEGVCKFHDWDNAMIGPAGLSISSVAGSVADIVRWYADGLTLPDSPAMEVLSLYVDALDEAGYATGTTFGPGLVGAALAGLLNRMVNYRPYPPRDEPERKIALSDLGAIIEDFLETCQILAGRDSKAASALAALWSRHQHYDRMLALVERAEFGKGAPVVPAANLELTGKAELAYASRLASAYRHSLAPDTVPAIETSIAERLDADLFSIQAKVATRIFEEQGVLALVNAFPPEVLRQCLAQYLAIGGRAEGKPLKVGDKRYMEGLSVRGAFNRPEVYAQPLLMRMFENLLGSDFVIGSMTLVVSQPGSQAQHLHIDHPHLFGDTVTGANLPPHAVTVLVPLVEIDELIGGTEVIKGSHRVPFSKGSKLPRQRQNLPLGSCLMFDYRLFHGGLPNRSDRNRPVLSIVYQRVWFRDASNFGTLPPLQVPENEHSRIPESLRGLFLNAHVSAAETT
jgi:hypothetical protein